MGELSNIIRFSKNQNHNEYNIRKLNQFTDELKNFNFGKINEGVFNLYNEIPEKLSLYKIFKYRNTIKNFIFYQCSIKYESYTERNILKEINKGMFDIYGKKQYKFIGVLLMIGFFLSKGVFGKISFFALIYINYKFDITGNISFFANANELLMEMQINPHYKLGRETREFVQTLKESESEITNSKFKKYFEKNAFDIELSPGDTYYNYRQENYTIYDYHKHLLQTLEKKRKINN